MKEYIFKKLAIKLPDSYLFYIEHYPPEFVDNSVGDNFIKNAGQLVELNLDFRRDHSGNNPYSDYIFNPRNFVIGYDGCGGYNFIEPREDTPVYWYDNEIDNAVVLKNNIKEFIEFYIELINELKDD